MDDFKIIITFLTVVFGLLKSFLDLCVAFKRKPRNGRKRSARNRTPSK